jgi:hypothetical protein
MLAPQSVLALRKKYDEAQLSLQKSIDMLSQLYSPIFLNAPAPSLNGLTKAILDAVAKMDIEPSGSCNSNQSGSMQSGIQKLSGKQAALNNMTGELLRKMLGENGEESGGDEQQNAQGKNSGKYGSAQQEAKKDQQHIADELKRLSDQYGKEAGSSLDKRAKQLEEEARQLAKQFEHPSQELIDHQKNFLSRMMETALSQHKQDEGKEDRVSLSAKNVFNPTNQKQPFQKIVSDVDPYFLFRQRTMSGNFPDSYRLSVKKYVDALGVLFLKPASH